MSMDPRTLRRNFRLSYSVHCVRSGQSCLVLVVLIAALGLVIGLIEGWSIQESIYFAFVSGLTIGYGDFAPKLLLTRVLAIAIGVCGVLLTGLVAAIAVKALSGVADDSRK